MTTLKSSQRKSSSSHCFQDSLQIFDSHKQPHVFIIFGASGDLAKKKIYPNLWEAFRDSFLPQNTSIVGFARADKTFGDIYEAFVPYINEEAFEKDETMEKFKALNSYYKGSYTDETFELFNEHIVATYGANCHHIFYLALPPDSFILVTSLIKRHCMAKEPFFSRIIVEKPFGHDYVSAKGLNDHIEQLFTEEQVYRIDHYLGKEMVQNLMALRFANVMFSPTWNRHHIANVMITFKEDIGTYGRGRYFDKSGIIRDIMQNHLIQILSLVAMEKPVSLSGKDIRDEKMKVLRCVRDLKLSDCVVGQYEGKKGGDSGGGDSQFGYKDDPYVPDDSKTPTYACAVLYIHNERWEGVPFILRCGKALNERKAEIRIQYADVAGDIFGTEKHNVAERNELVLRVQPKEAIYLKINSKTPGMGFDVHITELDLTYNDKYEGVSVPDAYKKLLLDVFCGKQVNFARNDELLEAWRIFTPALEQLEKAPPSVVKPYAFGARNGPDEATDLIKRVGFFYSGNYSWNNNNNNK